MIRSLFMRTWFLSLTFIFIFTPSLFARPAIEISADYIFSEKILIVNVNHPTHDFNHDFIRKISVTKKKEKPQIFYFTNQRDSKRQVLELPLEALPEEKIIIKAQCIDGGTRKIEFTVPPEEVGNKICPTEGAQIGSMGEGVKVRYEGKIYNLCCADCTKVFKDDPEKFHKIADKETEAVDAGIDHEGHDHK